MAASPVIVSARNHGERAFLTSLNDRFQQYVNRVRSMKEQSKSIENNTFIAHTQALENEIFDLKNLYEHELENCRYQIDLLTNERNGLHLEANKNGALAAELKDKYEEELTSRKKLENAVADAHRLLSEKDALIQELRITIAQHQNAHLDTQKERDNLQATLTSTQITCDTEAKAHADFEATTLKLTDQLQFERQVHDKEIQELNNKLAAAERALSIADEKVRERDIVDDNLHTSIANLRLQTQTEFKRFQDESEAAYQTSLQSVKNQLDNEAKNLAASQEENIHLKAIIEELNTKMGKLDGRCAALEDQNRALIQTLEIERQQASNTITQLEKKLREMQDNLNTKIRELNIAHNANIPLDLEIEAFASMLDAEEKRLSVALANLPSELALSARGDLISSRGPYTGGRSLPSSPRRSITKIGQLSPIPPLSRPKSTPAVVEEVKEVLAPCPPAVPLLSARYIDMPRYYLPHLDASSRVFKSPRSSYGINGAPGTRVYYRKNASGTGL